MKLIDWMREMEVDDAAMAKIVGDCTIHAVRKWKYGQRIPPPHQIIRIEDATRKKVTLRDFVNGG